MAKQKRLVIGNWKMYLESADEAADFVKKLQRKMTDSSVDIGIAAPFIFLPAVVRALGKTRLMAGAQTVSPHTAGAHTGEISAAMLKEAGASFVIVGHSERRGEGENNDRVAAEIERVSDAKLKVVLCVGESSRDESGSHFEFIAEELKTALIQFPKQTAARSLVIAYEPIWAIGKNAADAMKPAELRETVIFIRKTLSEILGRELAMKVPILYGGSVEESNARALIEGGDVAGFLVGHASSSIETFLPIIDACKK